MFAKTSKNYIETATLLILAGLFFLLSIIAMAGGISSYAAISEASVEEAELRTALSYFANQLRRGDESGCLEVTELFGENALAVYEYFDGYKYVTYIYYHAGYLREMFTEVGTQFEATAGTALMELKSAEFEALADGRILFTVQSAGGEKGQLALFPRTGGGS